MRAASRVHADPLKHEAIGIPGCKQEGPYHSLRACMRSPILKTQYSFCDPEKSS